MTSKNGLDRVASYQPMMKAMAQFIDELDQESSTDLGALAAQLLPMAWFPMRCPNGCSSPWAGPYKLWPYAVTKQAEAEPAIRCSYRCRACDHAWQTDWKPT